MQVKDIGSVVLLQACISFFGCITRVSAKDSDSMCVFALARVWDVSAQQPTPDHPAHIQVPQGVIWRSPRGCGAQLSQAQRPACL
jgi:hypothetical protein